MEVENCRNNRVHERRKGGKNKRSATRKTTKKSTRVIFERFERRHGFGQLRDT